MSYFSYSRTSMSNAGGLSYSFNDDVYAEEVLESIGMMSSDFKTPESSLSSSFSPPETVVSAFSKNMPSQCPSTPPVKIPRLNADNVTARRNSVSDRRNSISTSMNGDDFSFSPFSFDGGHKPHEFPEFDLEFEDSEFQDADVGIENTDKKWMKQLRECHERSSTKKGRKKFSQTLKKFNRAAVKIAKVIISEAHLPVEEKSIAPVQVGGVGGEKYIYAGIFFKFAIDGQGIYGGDMFAAKAAGCELNAIKRIFEADVKGLYTPYMALIDYRGFRLVATTHLPISKNTLKYGSDDGGLTIHNENETLRNLIETLGKKLNLKKHTVGAKTPTDIYGPADIEGHLGTDKRYYILDTARLFPPFPPSQKMLAFRVKQKMAETDRVTPVKVPFKNWEETITQMVEGRMLDEPLLRKEFCSGVVFYGDRQDYLDPERNHLISSLLGSEIFGDAVVVYTGGSIGEKFHMLFRSEIVLNNEVPLSSDAFTKFEVGPDKQKNEADIISMYSRLLDVEIPNLAETLNATEEEVYGEEICDMMHQRGINLRLMGTLRSHITNKQVDRVLLKEMIARSIKTDMRGEMRRVDSQMERSCIERTVTFLNLIFGNEGNSRDYWQFFIKTLIMFKFGKTSLTDKEKAYGYDLRNSYADMCDMFIELEKYMSVQFDESSSMIFTTTPDAFGYEPFHELDILKLTYKCKSSYKVPTH
eukprot:TRINITY_DN696_c0_g1_i1.p1 TRINITY_DN696_c0_g1~~TRINITY_DN696_c0_g1_i1.p1  ORF type:complete len:700 (+),score=142.97 TRINITY_DN696_c0_g1_i1:98-2197(+)